MGIKFGVMQCGIGGDPTAAGAAVPAGGAETARIEARNGGSSATAAGQGQGVLLGQAAGKIKRK